MGRLWLVIVALFGFGFSDLWAFSWLILVVIGGYCVWWCDLIVVFWVWFRWSVICFAVSLSLVCVGWRVLIWLFARFGVCGVIDLHVNSVGISL